MKILIFIFTIMVAIGCQSPNANHIKKNRAIAEQPETSENSMESNEPIVSQLQEENNELKQSLSILEFTSRAIISDTIPKLVFKNLVQDVAGISRNDTSYQFLYQLSLFANPNRNTTSKFKTDGTIKDVVSYASYTGNNDYFLHYLWKNIDRSPENIKYLFNTYKDIAYRLLQQADSYKSSGFKNTIKVLLLSYEELHDKEMILDDLKRRADTTGVLSDPIYTTIETQKMSALNARFKDVDFISYSHWAYSFWMRRNQENNMDTVYSIIKEFDKEMNAYTYNEEGHDEE